MKLDDEPYYNEFKSSSMITATVAAMVSGFFLIIGIVVFFNLDQIFAEKQSDLNEQNSQEDIMIQDDVSQDDSNMSENLNGYISGSTLTSDQLDFWDMYQEENTVQDPSASTDSSEAKNSNQNK